MSPPCRSRAIQDFVHGLLLGSASAARSLDQTLRDLANASAAHGAGLADLADADPRILHQVRCSGPAFDWTGPWDHQPDLLARLQQENRAFPVLAPTGHSWLVTALPDQRVLWLEDDQPRTWTAAEAAALTLCGLVLGAQHFPANNAPLDAAAALAGRMGHAFGNILTGILGFAELAAQLAPTGSPLGRHLQEILQAAYQGVELIQHLQQFQSAARRQPGTTDLGSVLTELEGGWKKRLHPGVVLEIRVPAELPSLELAAEPFEMALNELVANAMEAVGPQGRITLTAARLPPGVEIRVWDSGPGLSDPVRRRLAREVFFSTKPRHRGLGLALVRQVVRAHSGRFVLELDSQHGSVARLWLPGADRPLAQGETPREPFHP